MSKAKTRSKTRAVRKTKKRRNSSAPRAATATSRASAEPPESLPLPDRQVPMPFLFWATVPFRMMDMWFRAYASKG